MDNNIPEKKPKRPRIGQTFYVPDEGEIRRRYERPTYNNNNNATPTGEATTENAEEGEQYRAKRPYQQRPYQQRQGGYNNGGYRNHYNNGGYQQRPYQQRPQRDFENNSEGEVADGENTQHNNTDYTPRQQRPYQQRPYGGNRYNNNGGGYNNGGYNNGGQRPYGGGNRYNNNGGGYNNGGQRQYNNNRGGYQQRPYSGNNHGGYNSEGGQQRQGGYNNGGYNKRQNNSNGFPGRGKSFTPRPKRIEYEVTAPAPDEQIRLNKYMSKAGICSRREADEFIQQGLVKVNGQVVTELGTKITYSDVVEYDEKIVVPESKCYILLNKPKDCVTTSDDPNGRTTVLDLVKGACQERIYPVGRLDRNTTGVLLLTNDGDLASKLTHPKFVKKKIYHVWCDRDIAEDDMQAIADGIELEDGPIHADAISYATETDRNQAGIEIHSGRNRIVRRIFESLGYHVTKLDRVYFAGLTKKNLPRGRWRYLTQEEVNYLKMGAFE